MSLIERVFLKETELENRNEVSLLIKICFRHYLAVMVRIPGVNLAL